MPFGLGDREVGIDIRANDNGATQTIRNVGGAIGGLDDSSRRASSRFGALGSTISHISTGVFMGVGMMGVQALMGAVQSFGGAIIGMNANLETSTMQFTTLMGDADRAKEHVKGLFDFAAKTPFETQPIIQASRIMQTFGGNALNTKKYLTLFGDAAAATSAPINEVAFWMGRAYSAIKAGRPFGEAAMRLQELGILTPQVRNKMEDLQKSGAKGSKVWATLAGDLGRFSGAMERQAGTWDGMVSTFTDGVSIILAGAFFPLFEALKGLLRSVNEVLGSEGAQKFMRDFAAGMTSAFAIVGNIFGRIGDALGWLRAAFSSGGTSIGTSLSGIGAKLATLYQTVLTSIGAFIGELIPKLAEMARQFVAWVAPMIPPLLAELAAFVGAMFGWLLAQLPLVAEQLMKWASAFVAWVAPMIPPLLAELAKWALAIVGWLLNTGIPKLVGALVKVAEKFLTWVSPMVAKLPGALLQFLAALVGWIATKLLPTVMPKIVGFGTSIIAWLLGVLVSLPGKLMDFLTNDLIPALVKWGPKLLASMFSIGGQIVKGIINGLASLPAKIGAAIKGAFANLKIDIGPFHITSSGISVDLPKFDMPSFATGSWKLPTDMVAMVHKGEMIVPADIASRLRGESGAVASATPSGALIGGGSVAVTIHQYFGPSSVRSRDDIRDIGRETAERGRLLGASLQRS